jgi:hypothetical protein
MDFTGSKRNRNLAADPALEICPLLVIAEREPHRIGAHRSDGRREPNRQVAGFAFCPGTEDVASSRFR